MNDIVIEVSASWEKDDSKYAICGYSGHWEITKCKGHPDINGGHYSPDFTETPNSIKQMFKNRYSDRGNIIVKLTIIKDERNPTLENFF